MAELVLQGRRPAPDGVAPIRTRRGRASLADLVGQGSQSSQVGNSVNNSNKVVARKSNRAYKAPARSAVHESDIESDRLSLRESNLMSHTSMHTLAGAESRSFGPVRSGRPPLIPPSQQVNGRTPLVPPSAGPSRPVKRTRFEDVAASSSSSSQAFLPSSTLPAQSFTTPVEPEEAGGAVYGTAGSVSASLAQVMQDHPHAAKLLASIGYHTIADLKRIGVSVEDWPDLFQFLAGCDVETFATAVTTDADNPLDPLERFLLHST